jgi:imidazolonepropionase-like amidohydrolase
VNDELIVLTNGRIYDPAEGAVVGADDITIRDGAVESIGSASARSANVVSIDLGGRIVLPGLVDMHVHLVWSGGPDPASDTAQRGEQGTVLRALRNAQDTLAHGITSVRDLGGNWDAPLAVARAVEHGEFLAPNIVATGSAIVMTGGHDAFWGVEANGRDAVIAAVRRQVALGARVIKTAATGGAYGAGPNGEDPGQPQLTVEELTAIASEAHRLGLRVASHAVGREGIAASVAAGVDTVEHGILAEDESIAAMAAKGIALCPTLHTYRRLASGGDIGIPEYAVRNAQYLVEAHRETFRKAMDAGVTLLAGTDAGAPGLAHPSLLSELLVMNEYGLTPADCLRAATVSAARYLGLPKYTGRVEIGTLADLVVVDADIEHDLRQLFRPHLVMRAGRIVGSAGGAES